MKSRGAYLIHALNLAGLSLLLPRLALALLIHLPDLAVIVALVPEPGLVGYARLRAIQLRERGWVVRRPSQLEKAGTREEES